MSGFRELSLQGTRCWTASPALLASSRLMRMMWGEGGTGTSMPSLARPPQPQDPNQQLFWGGSGGPFMLNSSRTLFSRRARCKPRPKGGDPGGAGLVAGAAGPGGGQGSAGAGHPQGLRLGQSGHLGTGAPAGGAGTGHIGPQSLPPLSWQLNRCAAADGVRCL